MTEFRASDCGSDGKCDHDQGCCAPATMAVLSAVAPECGCGLCPWDGAPAACVAFLCDGHVNAERIAQLEHAEHNAQLIPVPTARALWDQLIATYPNPVALAA